MVIMAEREKSAMYPGVTWNDCLDFIRVVDGFKTKAVSYSAVAEKYGLRSVTTKSFTSRIGTAKQFGLIMTNNMTIQLTDNAIKLLYPTDMSIKKVSLECFSQAPLYNKLINMYDGKAVPSETVLSNILMSDFRITKSAKDNAAQMFLASCEQLGIIEAGVLNFVIEDGEKNNNTIEDKEILLNEERHQPLIEECTGFENNVKVDLNEYIVQKYPVESGKVAQIIIPIDSTEDDLWAVRDMLDVIMRRKFKIQL